MPSLLKQLAARLNGNQQQPVQQPQQQPNQQQQQQSMNPTPAQASVSENPLDILQGLLQNKDKAQTPAAPQLSIPQDKLTEVANKLSFASSIPQEIMQKLQAGDFSAFSEAVDHVGRAAYTQALQHSMHLTNEFVGERLTHERSGLEGLVGNTLTARGLSSKLQHMHPQARKMYTEFAQEIRAQFPDASEQDIEDTVAAAMRELGAQLSQDPSTIQQQQQQKAAEPNWDAFAGFGGESSNGDASGGATPQVGL